DTHLMRQASRNLSELHSFPTRRSSDLCYWAALDAPGSRRRNCAWRDMGGALRIAAATVSSISGGARSHPTARGSGAAHGAGSTRSEEHTSELQSRGHLVCRLLLEKKKS